MIPLTYRLRDRVRLTQSEGSWRVICDVPLSVLRVNEAAARLLSRTRHTASVTQLAAALALDEERTLRLCEYFRGKGLLDVGIDPAADVTPRVSVIVPAKDRASELAECLAAVFAVDYPREAFEVLVVDDGSTDDTAAVAGRFPCRVLVNPQTRGQSFARNLAATRASGEILAFIDSDCVADPGWLRQLVPFFAWELVVAVGGLVTGFSSASALDRYEEASSSLNMGRRLLLALDEAGTFYVPTCNLLVRREDYLAAGGIRDEMRVGEDVDLCWRLRARGGAMVYAPVGAVSHKHRDRLGAMLRRRTQYGTSEARLQVLHKDKRPTLPITPLPLLTFVALTISLMVRDARLAPLACLPLVCDATRRGVHLRREGIRMPARRVALASLRGHLSYVYFLQFRLVRYHLLALVGAGFVLPALWPVAGFAALYASAVDYSTRRPRLGYPAFLVYYVLEHSAYQVGVALGCLRQRTVRPYRLSFRAAAVGRARPARSRRPSSTVGVGQTTV